MRVYVLGSAAVFGRRYGEQLYIDENGDSHLLPVDRGPESPQPEWFDLPYWHGRGTELFTSGFGPWALTRLCSASGGIYFIFKDATHGGPTFDPNDLREYRPDYHSRHDYQESIAQNKLRSAVVQAAQVTRAQVGRPVLLFPAFSEQVKQNSLRKRSGNAGTARVHGNPRTARAERRRGREGLGEVASLASPTSICCMVGCSPREFGRYAYKAMCAKLRKNEVKFTDENNNAWRLVPDRVPDDTPEGAGFSRSGGTSTANSWNVVSRRIPGHHGQCSPNANSITPLGFRWEETRVTPPRAGGGGGGAPAPPRPNTSAPAKKPVILPKL